MEKMKIENTENLPDLHDRFKKLIIESDKICNTEERFRYIMSEGSKDDFINKLLKGLEVAENWAELGMSLRVLSKITENIPVPLFTFLPSEKNCKAIETAKAEIDQMIVDFDFKRANRLFEFVRYPGKYEKSKHIKKYTDKHRLIEFAMKLVIDHFQTEQTWPWKKPGKKDAASFIARCFLLRSRLALPKGSSIPHKKNEALNKAWDWAQLASKGVNDLKMEIALEKKQWDSNISEVWFNTLLTEYFNKVTPMDFSRSTHWTVHDFIQKNSQRLKIADSNLLKEADEKMLSISLENIGCPAIYYPLLQANAALRLDKADLLETKLKEAVNRLAEVPISKPLWNDTISLIDEIGKRDDYNGKWEDSAIKAWELCKKKESHFKLSIQLRWYWSRLSQLYDLAFQAALRLNNNILAAEIADSLKSRPTVKLQEIERYLTDQKDRDILNKLYESDGLYSIEDFMPGLNKINQTIKEKSNFQETLLTRNILDVPKGWSAIHFKIINPDQAIALIIRDNECQDKDKKCEAVKVNVKDVLNAFINWNKDNRSFEGSQTLEVLCKQIGLMLSPIVEKLDTDKLIIIPHGFLHRVPIHAGIFENSAGEFSMFFQKYQCLFLPSWALAPCDNNTVVTTEGKYMFINWNQNIELISDSTKGITEGWNYKSNMNDTAQNVLETLKITNNPPKLLVIFCNGVGDVNNPYNSRFLMGEKDLTHQMIIKELKKDSLKHTKVILTACESDLVTSNFEILDEHLSLTSAFLRKGANEIIGALFECDASNSVNLVHLAKNSHDKTLCEILTQYQNNLFEKKYKNMLNDIAVFRTIGFPVS